MRIRRNNVTIYDDPIARVLTRMDECWEKDVEEYAKLVALLGKLTEMKDKSVASRKVSPDQAAGLLSNFATAALLMQHERLNTVTSKAVMYLRPRGR
jgi:hypothetical protein